MRGRGWLLVALGVAGAAYLVAYEPRLHYLFPSVIDDWSALAQPAGPQLRELAELGTPEADRYRPGFVVWNVLQWHTLGAPEALEGPRLWGALRAGLLVAGVTLALAVFADPRRLVRDRRWWVASALVAGGAVAALTAPSLVVDVVRYGPQEPLLVAGCALGAALLVVAGRSLLAADPVGPRVAALVVCGLAAWWLGVLQKETSPCLLLLAPFLLPSARAQRDRWRALGHRRKLGLAALGAGVLLPFVPVIAWTVHLSRADDRLYADLPLTKSYPQRLADQLSQAGDVLHSPLPAAIVLASVALLAVRLTRRDVDWFSIGLLVVAFAFVAYVAEIGIVTSRYLLPPIVLAAIVLVRSAVALGPRTAQVVGVALLALGTAQAVEARGWVHDWVEVEERREALVREAAARAAGGCEVGYVGLNVELVLAVPVLVPLAHEPARDCAPGERFLVVIDPGGPGTETPPDDPVVAACAPETTPAYASEVGKIVRCTAS